MIKQYINVVESSEICLSFIFENNFEMLTFHEQKKSLLTEIILKIML